ncbi:C-1-tetrahydrofolate synthase, cytoplasmic [Phytophthora pseudosyringae]|uniref:C-1-tetrahydrofolate synthase, cytoplasmic n=1 Tax=Phytophthora pseudosyringae TaxID=221518 RepID=A0A8T1VAG6_9STRA|nr:C-1-tetrahydrofolate synthase, cytoplasmic [Phytophthora pseudosyringae]
MEKFFNIKCRASGLTPQCVGLASTIRALKLHVYSRCNMCLFSPCCYLDPVYVDENIKLLERGWANTQHHIYNVLKFNVSVVWL